MEAVPVVERTDQKEAVKQTYGMEDRKEGQAVVERKDQKEAAVERID